MSTVLIIAGRLIFFGLMFAQLFAVMDGVEYFTGWSAWLSVPLSAIVMMVPGLNAAAAIYGATSAWGWPWYLAVPVMLGGTVMMFPFLFGDMFSRWRSQRATNQTARTTWWRWLLWPVGVLLGSWLVSLAPVVAVTLFKGQLLDIQQGTWFEVYVVTGASAFFGGYIAGHLACKLAPSRKVLSGILLVTLVSCLEGLAVISAWVHHEPLATRNTMMAVIAVFTTAYAIYRFGEGGNDSVAATKPPSAQAT